VTGAVSVMPADVTWRVTKRLFELVSLIAVKSEPELVAAVVAVCEYAFVLPVCTPLKIANDLAKTTSVVSVRFVAVATRPLR
jgi:hypothetical protein